MAQPDSTHGHEKDAAPTTLDECQTALAEARREADELREKYLRAVAEAENARKWTERDAQTRTIESQRRLLRQLLEVIDNLERALATPADASGLRQGVDMTLRQLLRVLAQAGVERIAVEPGQPFDPLYHEAVEVRTGDVSEDTVVGVVQSGYLHDGIVLRPARVVVMRRGLWGKKPLSRLQQHLETVSRLWNRWSSKTTTRSWGFRRMRTRRRSGKPSAISPDNIIRT
jgi:molecular chaperone GrpE